MPWKRRYYPVLTARQAALLLLACALTGMLACWIGSGADSYLSRVSAKFSGAGVLFSGPPGAIPQGLIEKYRKR